MSSTGAKNFSESLTFKELSDNEFETLHPPQRMGNAANIAYGGYALAAACKAAALSVPEGYHIYSLLGNYLGPALTDRPLRASVQVIRQTRTFATRQVQVSQLQDNGKPRICLLATADFQTPEKGTLLEFSRPPVRQYSHYSTLPSGEEVRDRLIESGKVTAQQAANHAASFDVSAAVFDTRPCPEGIFAQNLHGIAKTLPTTQDSLALHERTTADWSRCRDALTSPADHVANLAFFADGAISFAPLSFSHLYLDDAGACSSLDFALRFFTPDVDMRRWHLREIQARVGAGGRTYGEAWIWDEEGRAVACMNQQSILRVKAKGKL